ncbi:hypothetical protein BOA8489_02848 [Boseongicola aestuarii]|uniref:DUF7867 domain-containing protein n=1 Tax=Boseongicola aestuarii TaxID=1470561 RepID=A0A238J312_9RHOB|nr:hypothetical protein BOA8489_02848 [Boseongicola aestuarii]
MTTAAKMSLRGGQIVATSNVKFAAQASGFEGASVIAGGEIDGTSNSDFGTCQADSEDHFTTTGRVRMAGYGGGTAIEAGAPRGARFRLWTSPAQGTILEP